MQKKSTSLPLSFGCDVNYELYANHKCNSTGNHTCAILTLVVLRCLTQGSADSLQLESLKQCATALL